jgi:hypothetical protein
MSCCLRENCSGTAHRWLMGWSPCSANREMYQEMQLKLLAVVPREGPQQGTHWSPFDRCPYRYPSRGSTVSAAAAVSVD